MPDVLNDDDMHALAAEYVLGTLEPDERVRAHAMLDVDHGFRAMVRIWERRFSELHLMVEPVDPPPQIWERIKAQLGTIAPAASEPAQSLTPAQLAAAVPAGPVPSEEKTLEMATPDAEFATPEAADQAPTQEGATVLAAAAEGQPGSPTLAAPAGLEAKSPMPRLAGPDPGRGLRAWRALALAMMVVAVALLALGGTWKFFPHRLPAAVQNLFQPSGGALPGPRRPPPSSQFEE